MNFIYFGDVISPDPTSYPTIPTPAPAHGSRENNVFDVEKEIFDILENGLNVEFEFEKSESGR